MAASPGAVLVVPEALVEHAAVARACRSSGSSDWTRAGVERAGFRVPGGSLGARGARHRRGGASSLSRVRRRGRGPSALSQRRFHAVRRAGRVARRRAASTCCSCRSTAATRRGGCRATCRRPRRSTWPHGVRPRYRRSPSLRYVYVQYRSGRRLRGRGPPACRPGPRRRCCGAANAGRSCRERHSGYRRRHVGHQDPGHRREGHDPRQRARPSTRATTRSRGGRSRTRTSGGRPRSRRSATCWPGLTSSRPTSRASA